ncbi:hypothetical protein CSC2_19170 [Clostridium zeae]|uniref:DNA-binding protein n=1 Tax=Clostridium zeae TaxID=2759022 RepID=A0ABQ1E9I1_9CLOT|nr:hypothetical protein [Clostridium zeae]GFZ31391.1 hypothetical protein CSC2_19170 [Clostridium zeae]
MDVDDKNKIIKDEEEYFNLNRFLKKKENQYILKVFGVSLVLYILAGNFVTTEGGSTSYFLALIASVLVVNGYEKTKENSIEK